MGAAKLETKKEGSASLTTAPLARQKITLTSGINPSREAVQEEGGLPCGCGLVHMWAGGGGGALSRKGGLCHADPAGRCVGAPAGGRPPIPLVQAVPFGLYLSGQTVCGHVLEGPEHVTCRTLMVREEAVTHGRYGQ